MGRFGQGKKSLKEAAISGIDLRNPLPDPSAHDAGDIGPQGDGELVIEGILSRRDGKIGGFLLSAGPGCPGNTGN